MLYYAKISGERLQDQWSSGFCYQITKKGNAREYSKVENLFFETMPNTATITSIERVENGELWMDYCL